MRITIVLGAFFPVPPVMGGAVEKVWFALAQEFVRRGHAVMLISRAYAGFSPNETLAGVHHRRIKGYDTPASLLLLKLRDLFYSWRARAVLPPADVIVTNTFWLPLLLRNKRRGQLYVHGARFPKGQMRFYRHAARLQTPSQDVARAISAEVPEMADRVRVIPNPLSHPIEPLDESARERIVLYVGRLHPEKGVHLLIEAFAAIDSAWRLVIIGPADAKFGGGGASYLEQLKTAAAPANQRIEFRGAIFEEAKLEREYRRARLFVYPSLAETGESFGLAPLEAMSHGCAALVSNLSCFQDFIRDGETGFIFDHRTADPRTALQAKLPQLMTDDALLERVGAAGYRKSAEYSLARVADQFLEDFASLNSSSHAETRSR